MVTDHKKDENEMDVDVYYSEIQELEQKNSELQDRLNECSQERNTFKLLLDEKEDQFKKSEESLRALRTERNKYLEISNNLTAQLEGFIDKQKNDSDEIRYLKEQLESSSTENKRLKEVQIDYETICNENNTLNDQLSSLRDNYSNEISKLKAQLESENEELKKVQNDYEVENNNLKDQLSSFRTDNKKLRSGQKSDSNDIRDLKAQLKSLSSENERLNKAQTNLSSTLRTESANLKKVTYDYEVMCGEHDKLKIHLENEKLKNKNSKQNNHSPMYTENSNLKVQNKENKKILSTLRSEKEVLTNQLAELVAENKKLKDNISTSSKSPDNYSAENDKLKDQLKQLEDKLKEKSKNDQLSTNIKVKNGEISNFQNKSNELEEIIQFQKKNDEYVKEINDLKNLLQRKEKEKQELIEKNINLKKEASQYQSALGTMTNYRMDDDDKNHSVQLKKDIEELQNKLKNYVTTLKGDFEIDFKAVNNLMGKYNIKTKVTPKQPNKPLIKAVLQHHIIKTITKDIRKYFKQNLKEGSIMHLEKEIATMAKDLENKLVSFSKTRSGDDTITQAASIKVRQEVNIALGNRGFSDVLSSENYTSHGYIIMKTTELNREMNTYRTIKDVNKRNYVEKLAPDLIREFIRIFQFRLKVQEPSAQIRWIKTESSIDPSIMEGNWDKDDIDNLEVEICSFPMIGRDLEDVEKRKIYTHAQIFIKRKKFITKGIDYLTSKKAKVHLELESDDDSYNAVD
ncbi:unnamed protein product [Rhizophagus irregularis]|nr:unnamed protein product [Rhizophagus irregularis]